MRQQTLDTRQNAKFRNLNYCLLSIACCLLLSSCFKEKNLLPPTNQGHGQTAIIEMGPDYPEQFYYSLSSNSVVLHSSRFSYDLMFDAAPDKFNIWLNTAKSVNVIRTGETDLDSVLLSDTLTNNRYYELGEFNTDSNAIGKWWTADSSAPVSAGQVYLIQLGVDVAGNPFGYVKMKVNNFSGSSYSITYSDFISAPQTVLIPKDGSRNYSYLTFTGGASVVNTVEPAKTDWDLCFTRYTVFFYAPYYIPYQVTGVLHNPSRTLAYMDSTMIFDSVQIGNFENGRLLNRRDAIGYEWKRFSSLSASGTYSINYHYTYFIKSDDKFYKLRFFDFEKAGVRGYPTFEYYEL